MGGGSTMNDDELDDERVARNVFVFYAAVIALLVIAWGAC